jgi:uncharacterized protein
MKSQTRWVVMACSVGSLLACDKLLPREYTRSSLMDAGAILDAAPPPPPVRTDAAPIAPDAAPIDEPEPSVMPQCGPRPQSDVAFSKVALLESAGQCARYRYCDFQAYQRDLTVKVAALRANPSAETQAAARAAWRFANASWQRAELFRFGPAASSSEPGGGDLRDYIQSYPLFDRCVVDEQTVSKAYEAPTFGASTVAGRTLPGLEYLLFDETLTHGCAASRPIEAAGQWRAIDPAELAQRKLAYADAIARDLDARTVALVDAWDPSKRNFLAEFSTAGRGSQLFMSEQAALNAIGAALFYVDKELKDSKLERPLGLNMACGDSCLGKYESPFARVSTLNIRQNLAGVRELFQGCGEQNQGLGFDDWLIALNAKDVADRMLTLLSTAEQLAAEIEGPLEDASRTDPARVIALKDAVKQMSMILRADVITLLDIDLPTYAEGDND